MHRGWPEESCSWRPERSRVYRFNEPQPFSGELSPREDPTNRVWSSPSSAFLLHSPTNPQKSSRGIYGSRTPPRHEVTYEVRIVASSRAVAPGINDLRRDWVTLWQSNKLWCPKKGAGWPRWIGQPILTDAVDEEIWCRRRAEWWSSTDQMAAFCLGCFFFSNFEEGIG